MDSSRSPDDQEPLEVMYFRQVAKLIDATGTWDAQLVHDIVWEEDAVNILSIPTIVWRGDFIAWHFDNKGEFSEKSAYHVLEDGDKRRRKWQQGEGSSSNSSGRVVENEWKQI